MKSLYTIVGMKYRDGMVEFTKSLPVGEPVTLRRQPDNAYDPSAVQAWARDHHIGFVVGHQARDLAPRMDKAGKTEIVATMIADRNGVSVEVEE